jgi:hypothetical protein
MKHSSIARRGAAGVAAAALTLGASALLAPAADAQAKAKSLKGSVTGTVPMTCNVFGTDFAYDATIKLSGVRATKKDKNVALKATMSKMPGVAPVAIDNDMQATLKLKVGSTSVTLKGTKHVTTAADEPVPMPPVKGAAKIKKNSNAVTVTSLSVYVPDYDMTMDCVPTDSNALGTLSLK